MLKENIHSLRKAKGLSQEALAEKLHVVRQTVSKWEKGLSVPDAELLLSLAEALDTSVSTLLGETIPEKRPEEETVGSLSKKLEAVNLRLAQKNKNRLRAVRCLLIFSVRADRGNFSGPGCYGQRLSDVGFQRPGACRRGHAAARL